MQECMSLLAFSIFVLRFIPQPDGFTVFPLVITGHTLPLIFYEECFSHILTMMCFMWWISQTLMTRYVAFRFYCNFLQEGLQMWWYQCWTHGPVVKNLNSRLLWNKISDRWSRAGLELDGNKSSAWTVQPYCFIIEHFDCKISVLLALARAQTFHFEQLWKNNVQDDVSKFHFR